MEFYPGNCEFVVECLKFVVSGVLFVVRQQTCVVVELEFAVLVADLFYEPVSD